MLKALLPTTLGAVILLTLLACEFNAQRIRATNEAAESPAPVWDPISAEIEMSEIQDGDCINSTLREGFSVKSVVIVPCIAAWHFRVLNSFTSTESPTYPGEDFFRGQAYEKCTPGYTYILFPREESWELGDRKINCLQPSFGLSIANPEKLERLVNSNHLKIGDCFNEAPETENSAIGLVELVDCSGDWEEQVTDIFSVSEDGEYPGVDYFRLQAEQKCDSPLEFRYFYPSSESWRYGERDITCLSTPP